MIAKELSKFDFSIDEYIDNPDVIIDNANRLLNKEQYTRDDVAKFINGMFQSKIQKAVCWFRIPRPFINGDTITLMYNGNRISGIVFFSPKQLEVGTIYKTHYLHNTVRLTSQADFSFSDEDTDNCEANDFALYRAKSLLLELVFSNTRLITNKK